MSVTGLALARWKGIKVKLPDWKDSEAFTPQTNSDVMLTGPDKYGQMVGVMSSKVADLVEVKS